MNYIMKNPLDSKEAREEAYALYSDYFKMQYGVRPRNELTYNLFMNGTIEEYTKELESITKGLFY